MLKIGVFGTGHLGKFHLNNWKEIEGTELTGFYDPDDAAAAQVTEQYGLKRFSSESELIAAVDAVDVVTPTQYHFPICAEAIRQGRHVFVEKPMAHTVEEARTLVQLAQESGICLQVGHVERFNPALLALKGVPLNPMFIEVHRLAQFNPRGTEVSVILDLMIHDIDVILSIVKSDVKHVSASGVAVMTDTPDIANVRMEFNNGCVANLTSSRISLKKMRKMRLFQKDAYIGIDFLEKRTEIIRMKGAEDEGAFTFDIDTPNGTKTFAIASPQAPEVNAIKAELSSFAESIRNGRPPVVNEIDGLRAVETAHLILQKIHHNLSAQ